MTEAKRKLLATCATIFCAFLFVWLLLPRACELLLPNRGLTKVQRLCSSVRVGEAFDAKAFEARVRAAGLYTHRLPGDEGVGVMSGGRLLTSNHCWIFLKNNVVTEARSFEHAP